MKRVRLEDLASCGNGPGQLEDEEHADDAENHTEPAGLPRFGLREGGAVRPRGYARNVSGCGAAPLRLVLRSVVMMGKGHRVGG